MSSVARVVRRGRYLNSSTWDIEVTFRFFCGILVKVLIKGVVGMVAAAVACGLWVRHSMCLIDSRVNYMKENYMRGGMGRVSSRDSFVFQKGDFNPRVCTPRLRTRLLKYWGLLSTKPNIELAFLFPQRASPRWVTASC